MKCFGRSALLGLTVLLTGCGIVGGSTPSTPVAATAPPAPATTTARPSAPSPSPSPSAAPSATTARAATPATVVYVAHTDGEGVYVRTTPVMSDKAQAFPDGTALTIVGPDVDGDGQHWKHVKAPGGLDGYVPSIYTDATPP